VARAIARACEEPEAVAMAFAALDAPPDVPIVTELDVRSPWPRHVVWTLVPFGATQKAALGIARDVTRERSAERGHRQLQALFDEVCPLDVLTGIPHGRRFREELEREHGRSSRAWDSYGLLRIDVDGMRALNDSLGAAAGDTVLEGVATCLGRCRREYDLLARTEGDEFALLLPGADVVAVRAVAARVLRSVASYDFELPEARRVSVCVGGACWIPPASDVASDVFRKAGIALVRAQAHGTSRSNFDDVARDENDDDPITLDARRPR
jgi:diguanylate cyclase (GGDEF)-like protein